MSTTQEATVSRIIETGKTVENNETYQYQRLQLETENSETIEITNAQSPLSRWEPYAVGEQIVLTQQPDNSWVISDYVRRPALFQLFTLFAILVVVVGRWWGVRSLISLGISFGIIFGLILPLIMGGYNPLIVTLLGALLIIPGTFYLSHGWQSKTHVAVVGTLISLIIAGLLAVAFVNQAHLTGYADEEASFLSIQTQDAIDIRGLLLTGIIISLLGTLDDITVSQASFVQQLKETNPKIKFGELFARGMNVGKDHIASLVNTLILVYTGASLPLLLLFLDSQTTWSQLLNLEIIADEAVRTLVGSIGIVLAAPITTLIAAALFSKTDLKENAQIRVKTNQGKHDHGRTDSHQ